MDNSKFDPKAFREFEFGVQRVEEALQPYEGWTNHVVTSKDEQAQSLRKKLDVRNVPDSFSKWQLPFIFDRSQLYISVAGPGATVPVHSHDEGDGIRFIASGSIEYEGKTLSGGDWMFIPKGEEYEFTVGEFGATMFYCYSCCCVN